MKKIKLLLSVALSLLFLIGCSTSNDSNSNSGSQAVPVAPTNLTGVVISPTEISLSWTDNSTNETSFIIERKTGTGVYAQIGTTNKDITTYSDTGLTPATTYTYRVSAINAAGSSPTYTNELTLTTTQITSVADFFPLKDTNFWTYKVQTAGQTTTSRDSLYVVHDTVIATNTYKLMKTKALPVGFFSTSLRNNGIRVDNNQLKLTGTITFSLNTQIAPISFNTSDLIIFKESANSGDILSTQNGVINQTIPASGTTPAIPLTITYTLKTVSDGSLTTYLSDGVTYNDLKKTKVILNLQINTQVLLFGTPITYTLMDAQDVLTSTQYYAKNIGMVYNKTVINYSLNQVPGVTLPFPQTGNQTTEEFLQTKLIH